jgi:hypothetical protein
MKDCWIRALSVRRPEIHMRWAALLRLERPGSRLGDADALVHLIDWTLDEVLGEVRGRRNGACNRPRMALPALRNSCHCGQNPLLNHFLACEQAMLEALVSAQAGNRKLSPLDRDTLVSELYFAIHKVASREVESFCSLCRRRPGAAARHEDLPAAMPVSGC